MQECAHCVCIKGCKNAPVVCVWSDARMHWLCHYERFSECTDCACMKGCKNAPIVSVRRVARTQECADFVWRVTEKNLLCLYEAMQGSPEFGSMKRCTDCVYMKGFKNASTVSVWRDARMRRLCLYEGKHGCTDCVCMKGCKKAPIVSVWRIVRMHRSFLYEGLN